MPTKSFMDYSTRARTLQTLANFDAMDIMTITDNDLAQFVLFGLPQDLQDRHCRDGLLGRASPMSPRAAGSDLLSDGQLREPLGQTDPTTHRTGSSERLFWAVRVTKHQIMEKLPFEYSYFEQRVSASVTAARSSTATSVHPRATAATHTTSREDFIWCVHAWLDSQGQCHFCKKTCGNAAGTCPGPVDKKYIPIPDSFQTPPKPPNYTPSRAGSNAGKPTRPSAGRPSTRSATVAGVAEENQFDAAAITSIQAKLAEDNLFNYATEDLKGCYGRLDSAAIAGYKARDVQRWANEDEKAQEEAESWADFADDIAGP
ncbi:hypothetical protein PSTT_16352 [Puccinia striiformis]|uniref:Uncharacterized protein n=1 Tax=Puccinia striiformis TaxID=27350 RepID=A0A2S4UDB8_9BASI|nr:hypothetical protein PSTT_16352 [Puccinia striiformis]